MENMKYCVVGAGAAGLAVLKVLREAGHEADCFEASDKLGGHWRGGYDCLHLITPRDSSGFEGFPMPRDYPLFPSRSQMRDYLTAFADAHGLRSSITFNTAVEAVTPDGDDGMAGWEVRTSGAKSRSYDAVIVANGHLSEPALPTYPGSFSGRILHSSAYRNPRDLSGDRVLVVGAGNSGCDIAVDAAQAGRRTLVSVRNGLVFQPKTLFGRPRSELPVLGRLPVVAQERIARTLIDVSLGRPERYGLPRPSTRNLHRNKPVVNGQLLHQIHHGRVEVVPAIKRLEGAAVHFADGTQREVDTIVLATGFRPTIPFVDKRLLRWQDGVPLRVAGMTMPVGVERLFLVGLAAPRGPQLPVYSAQARLIAKFLELQERLPIRLSERWSRTSRPESRIDVPRHEWQRDMARTQRHLKQLLSETTVTR